jgi:hypothetical protein
MGAVLRDISCSIDFEETRSRDEYFFIFKLNFLDFLDMDFLSLC